MKHQVTATIKSLRDQPVHGAGQVRLRIGTLALPGYARGDATRLSSAFRVELARLLQRELRGHAHHAEKLVVPRFVMREGEPVERTGRRLARVIAEHIDA
jgi:hypothetical protein